MVERENMSANMREKKVGVRMRFLLSDLGSPKMDALFMLLTTNINGCPCISTFKMMEVRFLCRLYE